MILIHAFVKADIMDKAEAVLASMIRASADAQQGWRMMIASLLQEGRLEEALKHLLWGGNENWVPDSKLYELLITALCKAGDTVSDTSHGSWCHHQFSLGHFMFEINPVRSVLRLAQPVLSKAVSCNCWLKHEFVLGAKEWPTVNCVCWT